MNQTFDPVQTTHILYEISMSIGTSVELRPMLKTSLSTILKKLNCVSGGVYQKMEQLDGACWLEAVYTIPRQPQRNPTYQEALDRLPICPAQTDYAHFLAELPAARQSQEGHTHHILELPDFGVLLLIKNREALPEPLLKSLAPLLNKLAAAALACVNAAKLRQSEERYRLFTETTFDGILVHDGPIIKEINPALAELIAYKPEELVGKNIFDFLDASCHELAAANALQLTTTPYPLVAVKKDGARLPVEVTDREYTEAGHTYRITAVRNLSQQKQLETELAGLVERRTRQVQIATEVAQAIAAATNLEDLYKRIVTEVTEKFGYYYAQVLRYNPQLNVVKLVAGYGEVGEKMLALGHKIPLNQGLIGAAASAGETFLRPDLADDPDWKPNQLLPETKGEIAVPIKLGDQILGVLDVQSNQANALDKEDQMLLEGLCGQIAVAINTTRLTTDLLETSTFLNSVIDNIPNMVFVKDAEELRFIQLNKVGQSYFGLELDQIAGKNDFDFFPEEQAAFFVAKDKEVLASGQLLDIPEENIDSAFGARVLHTTKVPVMGSDGSPKYLLGISHDITEQKDIETELIRFKLGMERSVDAIFMTDKNGRITYVNDAFVDIYGYTKEEAIGNTPRILKSGVIPPERYHHFWQTLLSGGIVAGEIVNKAKNGRLITIEGNNNPIQDDSGQIIGFLAMHRDITARKQTEEALQQSELALQEILKKQQDLHAVGLELAAIDDLDELYKQVIRVGVEKLGFDRLGLFLLDIPIGVMTGSYGISPHGEFRSEKDDSFSFQNESWMRDFIYNNEHLIVYEDTDLYEKQTVIGRGWHMVAALWIHDTPVGVLFADNLLSQEPLKPYQPDLLTAYGAIIANLIARLQSQQLIRENEQTMQAFLEKQQALHEIGILLSAIENPAELYEKAIALGQDRLGFERLGLYLLDQNQEIVQGTYGIGADGVLRNEAHEVFLLADEPWLHTFLFAQERVIVNEDVDLHEDGIVVGRGWSITTALWVGSTPMGLLFSDNLLTHTPLYPYQSELLAAYGATIANLIHRLRTESERKRLLQDTEVQAKNLAQLAANLQTVADLSTQITSMPDPQKLMEVIVQETQQRFELYHCHIFLLDETGKNLRIQACGWHSDATHYGAHGDSVIPLHSKKSLVAQAARTRQAVIINDVHQDPNWLPNEFLPDTRAEMAIPMIVGDTVMGVFDVQSNELDRFDAEDVKILATLASQIAVALENARSLKRSKEAVEELNLLTRRLTREGWNEYLSLRKTEETSFVYDQGALTSLSTAAVLAHTVEAETAVPHTNGGHSHALNVHGEAIGHFTILDTDPTETATDEENAQAIIQAVIDQLSARIENIRLAEQTQDALAQTQTQAQRLQLLNEISTELSNQATLQDVIDLFITRMPELLSVDHISMLALKPDGQAMEIVAYRGADGNTLDTTAMPEIPIANTPMAEAFRENRLVTGTYDELSTLTAPLFMGKRPFGALSIASAPGRPITPQDESILQQMATILNSIMENKQLLAIAQTRADRERLVRTITDKIRRGTDREAILAIARDEISQMLGAREAVAQLGTKNQLLERLQQTTQEQNRLTIDD